MSRGSLFLLTADETVFARFRPLSNTWAVHRLAAPGNLTDLPVGSLVAIDSAHPRLPAFTDSRWRSWCGHLSVLLVSSDPNDEQGLAAFEVGVSGYCHAYSAELTLRQVVEVVANGELWVGRSLLGRLLRGVGKKAEQTPTNISDGAPLVERRAAWSRPLTDREREVAQRAALGESNLSIADALGITERTVKAHLTTIFEKLGVADRLQLALKVHGVK